MLYQKHILLQRVVDIYLSQLLTPSSKSKKKKQLEKFVYIFPKRISPTFWDDC